MGKLPRFAAPENTSAYVRRRPHLPGARALLSAFGRSVAALRRGNGSKLLWNLREHRPMPYSLGVDMAVAGTWPAQLDALTRRSR